MEFCMTGPLVNNNAMNAQIERIPVTIGGGR